MNSHSSAARIILLKREDTEARAQTSALLQTLGYGDTSFL